MNWIGQAIGSRKSQLITKMGSPTNQEMLLVRAWGLSQALTSIHPNDVLGIESRVLDPDIVEALAELNAGFNAGEAQYQKSMNQKRGRG